MLWCCLFVGLSACYFKKKKSCFCSALYVLQKHMWLYVPLGISDRLVSGVFLCLSFPRNVVVSDILSDYWSCFLLSPLKVSQVMKNVMCTFCHERALSTHWTTPCFYVFSPCIQCMCCFNSRLLFFFVGAEKVIIACRDMEKANAAVKDIIESSGNEHVVCMKLDLSDSKSIREFAEAINKGKMIFWLKKHPCEHTWKVAYF